MRTSRRRLDDGDPRANPQVLQEALEAIATHVGELEHGPFGSGWSLAVNPPRATPPPRSFLALQSRVSGLAGARWIAPSGAQRSSASNYDSPSMDTPTTNLENTGNSGDPSLQRNSQVRSSLRLTRKPALPVHFSSTISPLNHWRL